MVDLSRPKIRQRTCVGIQRESLFPRLGILSSRATRSQNYQNRKHGKSTKGNGAPNDGKTINCKNLDFICQTLTCEVLVPWVWLRPGRPRCVIPAGSKRESILCFLHLPSQNLGAGKDGSPITNVGDDQRRNFP